MKTKVDGNGKPFFTAADCDRRDCAGHVTNAPPDCISLTKANALIRERGKVVWTGGARNIWGGQTYGDTHKALLICVEEIEADSAEKVLSDWVKHYDDCGFANPYYERARKLLEAK